MRPLNLAERAVVLGVDEKCRIRALNRTAPILPMLPGVPERATQGPQTSCHLKSLRGSGHQHR